MTNEEKYLTLEEILKEMKKLKYRLLELKEKLRIGFFEIKAITWKDIKSSSSSNKGDVMLNKMIKTDGTREEFETVKSSFNSYRQLAIEKIGEMIENTSKEECIVYFRDRLHWRWEEIAAMFDCSEKTCRRKYKALKKQKKTSIL